MDESEFKFNPWTYPGERVSGISGFMRLRNEAEFLPQVIESWIDALDELVIVYNRCEDGTDIIAKRYRHRYPDKIKVYHYEPHVYPQGSTQYRELPSDSVHSLVNYYNYTLSKTTRTVCVKIDGDDIAMPAKLKFMCDEIRRTGVPQGEFWMFVGINLWLNDGKLMINASNTFCGYDHGFFAAAPSVFFLKGERCEFLSKVLKIKTSGFMYYHAKGIKKDHGNANYDFATDPNSMYLDISNKELRNLRLITFDELIKEYPNAEELRYVPRPEELIKL